MGKTLSKKLAGTAVSRPNGKPTSKAQSSYTTRAASASNHEVSSQVNKIMSALNEANQISSGRKKGKSFDDFLKEI